MPRNHLQRILRQRHLPLHFKRRKMHTTLHIAKWRLHTKLQTFCTVPHIVMTPVNHQTMWGMMTCPMLIQLALLSPDPRPKAWRSHHFPPPLSSHTIRSMMEKQHHGRTPTIFLPIPTPWRRITREKASMRAFIFPLPSTLSSPTARWMIVKRHGDFNSVATGGTTALVPGGTVLYSHFHPNNQK